MTMMKREIVRVTDETPRAEIADLLAEAVHQAGRTFRVVGSPEHPTDWDAAHELIDELLSDYFEATT